MGTLVVYESKYGLSETIARDLGRVLGPARVCRAGGLLEPVMRKPVRLQCATPHSSLSSRPCTGIVRTIAS